MTFVQLKQYLHEQLGSVYERAEIQSLYFRLLEHYGRYSKTTVLAEPNHQMPTEVTQTVTEAIKALQTAEPIQYVLGEAEFCSYRFFVDKNVLIPRPETEELVDWVYNEYKNTPALLRILDIGTGSGAIAIALKKLLPQAQVTAIDISAEALAIAQRNAQANETDIRFVQQDILATDSLVGQYDIIISNPPYVRLLEQAEMHPNVLQYEPHLALFVPDEQPLLFYYKIAQLAYKTLTSQGALFFEINQYLGKETQALMYRHGFTQVVLRKDISGNDRMLRAKKV